MVPTTELLARIQMRYPELRKGSDELNDTARSYIIPGHLGSFGFISSMSDHFCGSCNRLRLTADGQIKVRFHLFAIVLVPQRAHRTVLNRSACLTLRRYHSATRCALGCPTTLSCQLSAEQ